MARTNDECVSDRGLNSDETDWNDLTSAFGDLGLNESLVDALYVYGSNEQSPLQVRAMLTSKSRYDFLIRSLNTSDNGIALSLAVLNRIDIEKCKCQALILTASHIEAQQMYEMVMPFCLYMDLKVRLCSKTTNIQEDIHALQQQVHLIIGTSGRIFDLISIDAFHIETIHVIALSEIEHIILNGYKKFCQHFSSLLNQDVNVYVSSKCIPTSEVLTIFKRMFIELGDRCVETPVVNSDVTRNEEVMDMFCRINLDSMHPPDLECDSSFTIKSHVLASGEAVLDPSIETDLKSASSYDLSLCHTETNTTRSTKHSHSNHEVIRFTHDDIRYHLLKPMIDGCDEVISSLPSSKTSRYIALSAVRKVNAAVNYCQVLIVAASRRRSKELLNALRRHTVGIRSVLAIGGKDYQEEESKLFYGAHIVIGTPGRLMRLMSKLSRGKGVKLLVFDGIDYMLGYDINKDKLYFLLAAMPMEVQILFTTAKVSSKALEFVQKVFAKKSNGTFHEQLFVVVKNDDWKLEMICNILKSFRMQTVIACDSRDTINVVANTLREKGFAGFKIHEEMPLTQRTAILENFRCGFNRVLISTHVSTQTFRETKVPLVINYDTPNSVGDCIQRQQLNLFGPTAAINFITY